MLKYIVAVAAVTIATPVYAFADAQGANSSRARADAQQQAGSPDKAAPATTTPGTPSAVPPAQAPGATRTAAIPPATPVKTIEGTPQTPARQVAAIVSREFGAYDANRSGRLEKEEFAKWMAAMKAHAPAREPGESVSKPWTEAAFKQANTSGTGAVTREELTAFLIGAKPVSSGG